MARVVVDPVTRIEGHLRIEAEVDGGAVRDAWSSSTMFRGIELILKGRDPRDAWAFTQRICGVCTTVHAIASIRAVENAIGATPPPNSRLLRNLIIAAQAVQDHVIHFYHLHALDWVDIVSALSADPVKTSSLAESISDWPLSSPKYFAGVRDRIKGFVDRGQLGPFANAYWGHPAYRLPAEANLMAVAHYLEALDWQREFIQMHAVLGGKNPHLQSFLVGGMATPVDPNSQAAINAGTIADLKRLVAKARDFVRRVYIPDLLAIASFYKDWAGHGRGVGNYLAYGEYPDDDTASPALFLPRGVIRGRDLSKVEPFDQTKVTEYVAHSWYEYQQGDATALHPFQGETSPNYTGPTPPYELLGLTADSDKKYSWLKSPRYDGLPMEVGPLSRMLIAYASGHARVKALVDAVLKQLNVGPEALFSTLGRVAARGIETLVLAEKIEDWVNGLATNMASGDLRIHDNAKWDPGSWPAEAMGAGFHEAPRGALGHWVSIRNGAIANYQCVVPSTWNAGPRDAKGQRGPYEEALIGTPVADLQRPVEILRTVHSFDPCMACGVHVVDAQRREVARVRAV
jgi:[NiFe] hydrogenase large subunit/hydrogenase large subunit